MIKKAKALTGILISFILGLYSLHAQTLPKNYFSSPVDFRIYLAANFGEIRTNHFHSGLDIKTKGRSGEFIRAAADGYVVRISISPGGFGKAIYINHPNGYTTVYGHLNRFTPDIEKYIKENQYSRKTFRITLFPTSDRFVVKKSQIIGYSGNTGSSTGPHLHFEIRDTGTEHPTNPLLYGFEIPDNIPPVINSIVLYPMGKQSSISEKAIKKKFRATKKDGNYILTNDAIINISGPVGVGIETYDLLNDVRNKCSIYSIELKIDGKRNSYFVFNEFAFSETRYMNSHIDYAERLKSKTTIRKTFVDPNNKLRIYQSVLNRGIFSFNDENVHEISLVVKDSYNNTSTINFRVRSLKPKNKYLVNQDENDYLMIFPFDKENKYGFDGFEINIPSYALYDSLKFKLVIAPKITGTYSKVYYIHNKYVPIQKYSTIRIKPENVPPGLESKLLLAALDDKKELFARGGKWNNGMVEMQTREFGIYLITADTISPNIRPYNFKIGPDLSHLRSLKFTITDNFSGIDKYTGYIDGQWVLFEYDPKKDRLFYTFDEERLERNKEHELILKVSDKKENETVFNMEFYW